MALLGLTDLQILGMIERYRLYEPIGEKYSEKYVHHRLGEGKDVF